MSNTINRVFKISDGLASIAGKKIKSAVSELQKEGVITKQESSKIVKQLSKMKKNIYDNLTRELKKVLHSTTKKTKKKSGKKKRA